MPRSPVSGHKGTVSGSENVCENDMVWRDTNDSGEIMGVSRSSEMPGEIARPIRSDSKGWEGMKRGGGMVEECVESAG